MVANAMVERDNASGSNSRRAFRQRHFNIVVLQESPIERVDSLIDGLLDRENEAAEMWDLMNALTLRFC